MRILVHIALVIIILAILLLPFCFLVRHFSRKYRKQGIGESKKYATVTITDKEVVVKNETNLDWESYSVHIFTKSLPKINEGFTYCPIGASGKTICTGLCAGETVKCPLDRLYSFMPEIQYDKTWKIYGSGVNFTTAGSDEEYEYYQKK